MTRNKILIIDDEQELINQLYFFLDEKGYIVQCCIDSEDGLKAVLENDYDVILLDYNMPAINKSEVFDKIKEKPNQKVIFLSDNCTDEAKFRVSGRENYPEGFVYKPFDLLEIKAIIDAVISGINIYKSTT
ncbi:MAG: response regulator [Candidatus Muirbacterium halophilum]|nr:response regulator [Candidatus Muirbacterium halophilum]MCK9477455.1 response regulator [Candidatus Muirbacterium halophilum]